MLAHIRHFPCIILAPLSFTLSLPIILSLARKTRIRFVFLTKYISFFYVHISRV